MRPHRIASMLAAGTLILAACGGGSANDAAPAATASEAPDTAQPAEPTTGDTANAATTPTSNDAAPEALRFSAPLVGGGEIDARTLAGKPTVFWFWAPT